MFSSCLHQNGIIMYFIVIISINPCRLGMSSDSITSRDREKTKRIVYSLIYGIGEPLTHLILMRVLVLLLLGKEKLSQLLNISPESAQHLTTSFLGEE